MYIVLRSIGIVFAFAFGAFAVNGQAVGPRAGEAALRASPAFAEVVLRETELKADVEAYLAEYTDDFPKVKEARVGIERIQKEKQRLMAIKEAQKLTLALGKLMVRKVDAEVELWRLQQGLADGHPDVKRARKKVEIFEAAIREILG